MSLTAMSDGKGGVLPPFSVRLSRRGCSCWRRATGGVIHGFRHTAEALFHVLESRLHGVRWPSRELPFHVRHPAMTEHGSFGCSLVSLSSNLHRLHGPSDG